MNYFYNIIYSLFWFATIISVVVFIHEYGHYKIARLCGVKVEVFSIGFGKELFEFKNRSGTRWKLCMLPFGGFIKMFGDADPASNPDFKKLNNMSEEDKKISFHYKPLIHKALIVFAGPAANYLSAIIIIFGMFLSFGKFSTSTEITNVLKDSPAEKAGIKNGDVILEVNESAVESFEDAVQIIALNNNSAITLKVLSNNQEQLFEIIPEFKESKDPFGNKIIKPILGITSNKTTLKSLGIGQAFTEAVHETYSISVNIFKSLWYIISGQSGSDKLGGPIKIAQYSGQVAQLGIISILWFIALISINLGLFNLLPIPILDGGHLMYYLIESISGKPPAKKFQDYGLKVGFVLLLFLMIFATVNDIRSFF